MACNVADVLCNLPDFSFTAPFSAIEKVGGNLNLPFGNHAFTFGDVNLPFGQDAIDVKTADSHNTTTEVSGFLNPKFDGVNFGAGAPAATNNQ